MGLKEQIKSTKLFILDMDGTIYRGNKLFPFTTELLEQIKAHGKKYIFTTNNSSKGIDGFVKKLESLGVVTSENEIVSAALATALYLKENCPDEVLYVSGTKSFKAELSAHGLTVTENREEATCAVMSSDTELTYKKICDVSYLLTVKNAKYIAANSDDVVPTEFGAVPDCGSFCDMIYNSTGRRPIFIGKPKPAMAEIAMKRAGCCAQETLLVGDRLDTDIMCGINAGVKTVLTLSGDTTEGMLSASKVFPDYVIPSCEEILNILKAY